MVGKGSGRKQSYRKLDLERAMKATIDAGLKVRRVTFDHDGRPQLEIGDGAAESEREADAANEWDEVKHAADEKRTA